MKRFYISVLLIVFSISSIRVIGQINDSIFSRLNGISNQGYQFYNIDGYEISNLKMKGKFSKKDIRKKYKKLRIREDDLIESDTTISLDNYYVNKTEKVSDNTFLNSSYYFIKINEDEITAVTFDSYNKVDVSFHRKIVSLILNNKIPLSVYSPLSVDSINFGGRTLKLGGNCRWMNINNIQCSGHGQMNWSVCKNKEISERFINNHRKGMELKNNGKVISEGLVDVIFEGVYAKATKLIWDFTGVTSALVGISGGKTLTIYLVSAPVRGNYISCIMSFWNNDKINQSGLTSLIEEVMQLKE